MMFSEKIYPYLLVVIQFCCLIYLLTSGPKLASGYAGILVESAGIFLGVYAIYIMRIGNFNISPRPKENGVLVTTGPYSVIRHPMYLAQLIALIPLVIDYFSYWRLLAFLILIVGLMLKVEYEEKRLKINFSDYFEYTTKTKKILPYIY